MGIEKTERALRNSWPPGLAKPKDILQKKKNFRDRISWLVEAAKVEREKLPPGELTKDPIQRPKATVAPGLLSRAAGTLQGLGVQQRSSSRWGTSEE